MFQLKEFELLAQAIEAIDSFKQKIDVMRLAIFKK